VAWSAFTAARPTPDHLERLWRDLADRDAFRAFEAVCALSGAGDRGVAYLRGRLDLTPPDVARIRRLIADLDSEEFATREAASKELRRLGHQAEGELLATAATGPPLEQRARIEELLRSLRAFPQPPELLRSLRAVAALEHIGDAEAKALLQEVGKGSGRAALEAQAALRRLTARP
jgi:hypothetical protein